MTQDLEPDQNRPRKSHTKLWLALAIVVVISALLIIPPLISINRYQSRITQLVSESLGRPVQLSSVELRMLPRPGFLLTNLTVEEDPAYGAEPVLHANTVMASIRLLPLWRGELQISRISVDEASLNLVHTATGQWNIDPVFRTASSHAGAPSRRAVPLPYMEATNSRINIKNGFEKLPFSLLDADASFSRESNGQWHVRLRAQPARTDVNLDLADTGIVRVEATLREAPTLQQMPVHVDMDWREAQLGQLSKLLVGSDEGWRGDLTGELHLDGTAESAKVTTRLRASGVHRAEFAPAAPLDFDANCGFIYKSGDRSLQHLVCESPIGDGRARLTGEIPGAGKPDLTVELDHIPAQAGLDVLRTLRSNLDPGLQAAGTVSGKMTYAPVEAQANPEPTPGRKGKHVAVDSHAPAPPLSGSFVVENLKLTSDSLSKPIQIAKMAVEPAPVQAGQGTGVSFSASLPAGAPEPIAIAARLGRSGFQIGVHGAATLARLRELAHVTGIAEASTLSAMTSEPADLDLSIAGSWLPGIEVNLGRSGYPGAERMVGTVALHDATWKSAFLANAVELKSATLHVEQGALRWDPLVFSYGPVQGTATLALPTSCEAPLPCVPHFTVNFDSLKAEDLQSAILGARTRGTVLSTLLSSLKPSSAPAWPQLEGTLQAGAVQVGPLALTDLTAEVHVLPSGAEVPSYDAGLLGGRIHGNASLSQGEKPTYMVEGTFSQLNPGQLGQMVGMRWSGGTIDGTGQVQLSGYSEEDLTASAKGTLHFNWEHGVIGTSTGVSAPNALAHFDRWTGDGKIGNGVLRLEQNQVQHGTKKSEVQASVSFGSPAKVDFPAARESRAAKP